MILDKNWNFILKTSDLPLQYRDYIKNLHVVG